MKGAVRRMGFLGRMAARHAAVIGADGRAGKSGARKETPAEQPGGAGDQCVPGALDALAEGGGRRGGREVVDGGINEALAQSRLDS